MKTPRQALREERQFRAFAQRMLDDWTAKMADDGVLPFGADPRGARIVHRDPMWRAVVRGMFR